MKLSLDELKIESYSSQISENELTEVKGGTAWFCWVAQTLAEWEADRQAEADCQFWYDYAHGIQLDEFVGTPNT